MQHTYKLFIVVNEDRFFLSHRKEIALGAVKAGYDVHIVSKNTGCREQIEQLGLQFTELQVNPTGTNLLEELRTLRFLHRLYKRERPDIVHHVGVKMILWGGVAARLAKVPAVLNAVSGLGVLFSVDGGRSLMRSCVLRALRFAHRRKNVLDLFQNQEDRDLFFTHDIAKPQNTRFIKGSGVDLQRFWSCPEPDDHTIRIVFTGRMVEEKGVLVLIEAAEQLRATYAGRVQFTLCGEIVNNPTALKRDDIERLCDGQYIKYLGYCANIDDVLRQSHIVAFPSYYREGVPKSLIDACAIGRPIVTTDSTGCRDTVDERRNGFLVPIKDATALAQALATLIDDKPLRIQFGQHSRMKAEHEFSIEDVVAKHLAIYSELLKSQQPKRH